MSTFLVIAGQFFLVISIAVTFITNNLRWQILFGSNEQMRFNEIDAIHSKRLEETETHVRRNVEHEEDERDKKKEIK